LIKVTAQVSLVLSEPVKTVLLRNSPSLTCILLIEITSVKDVIRLYIRVANEEAIAMEFSHGDMGAPVAATWCRLLNILIEDVRMPTELSSGIEEDIAQGRVEGMSVRDALQRLAMKAIQDDVLRASDLVSITRQNHCNLPDSSIRGLVAPPVTARVKAQCNATLLLSRHGPCQLKSLLVEAHSRM
jgi:hypothetical protein